MNDERTLRHSPRELSREAIQDLVIFAQSKGWDEHDRNEMIETAREVHSFDVADINTAVGWAITLQRVRVICLEDGVSFAVIFHVRMLQETTAMFKRCSWEAAQFLRDRREGGLLFSLINWLLYVAGLVKRKPRTAHSYQKRIASYAQAYIEEQRKK